MADYLDKFTPESLSVVSKALSKLSDAQIYGTDIGGLKRLKRSDMVDGCANPSLMFINSGEWAVWNKMREIMKESPDDGCTMTEMVKRTGADSGLVRSLLRLMSEYTVYHRGRGMRYGRYFYAGHGLDDAHDPSRED